MKTIVEALQTHAGNRGDQPALWYGEQTITFAEVDERSSRVATALAGAGVRPGDRVALLDKNSPEFVDLLFGTCKLGAVLVPVNWRLAPAEVAFVVGDAGANVLVVGPDLAASAQGCDVETTLVLGEQFDTWRDGVEPAQALPQPAAGDVAIQMYTSGTTGLPKGAMLTHDNLACLLRTYSAFWNIDESAIGLTVLPLYHIAGVACLLVPMGNGCSAALLREAVPGDVLAAIARYRVTTTIFVPALIQALLACDAISTTDVSSLELIGYGASPISDDVLVRAMEAFGCDFQQGYALTETSAIGTYLNPEDHRTWRHHPQRLRSAGRPMPGAEVRVVEPAGGGDCPLGEVGEVWLRSGGTMAGYWDRPEASAEAVTGDGWFRSGDAGYLDDEGYLYIHDRIKDMIVSGAENVYPAEVENVLMAHPGVADAAVIGVPDEQWGETVKAVVVRSPGTELNEAELIEWCRSRLAHYKCPKTVDWAQMLPRNPTGKLLKRELREPYWAGRERRVN